MIRCAHLSELNPTRGTKMRNRKPLEIDLQEYKRTHEECELKLKEQQEIIGNSLKNPTDFTNEDSLKSKNNIETLVKQIQELEIKIGEVEFQLKYRKDHINDYLKHINQGNKGLPKHWQEKLFFNEVIKIDEFRMEDFKQVSIPLKSVAYEVIKLTHLLEISKVATQLTLDNNHIKIIPNKNYRIDNSDESITIITCFNIYEFNNPVGVMMTEYLISNQEGNHVTIKVVSDKMISCHENSFSDEDINLEKKQYLSINDINETIKNDIILKVIINHVNCMDKNVTLAIEKVMGLISEHNIITSHHHDNWLLLHETLTTFLYNINLPNFLIKIADFLASECEENSHTQLFFYQTAQDHLAYLFQEYNPEKLTGGLSKMRQEYLNNALSPIQYISFCQNEIMTRGKNWNRSKETIDLYKAITDITFEKNNKGYIVTDCLKRLEKAVERYINPPKNKSELESDIKKYIKQYQKYETKIEKLLEPVHEIQVLLKNMFSKMNENKLSFNDILKNIDANVSTLLNLEQCIKNGNIPIYIDKYHHFKLDVKLKNVTYFIKEQDFLLNIDIDNKKINIADTAEKTTYVFECDKLPANIHDALHFYYFKEQDISYTLNNHEITISIEHSKPLKDAIKKREISLSIGDQTIRLIFINQPRSLEKLIRSFNDTKLIACGDTKDARIPKTISSIRDDLQHIRIDDMLIDIPKRFTVEKNNEMLNSIHFILEKLDVLKESPSLDNVIDAFYECKPHIQLCKEYAISLMDCYSTHSDNSIKIDLSKYLFSYYIDKFIKKYDDSFRSFKDDMTQENDKQKSILDKINITQEAINNDLLLDDLLISNKTISPEAINFYKQAQKSLLKLFVESATQTLSRGLNAMIQHHIKYNPDSVSFIYFCQAVIIERGMHWNRSKEAIKLYQAITDITFDQKDNGKMNTIRLLNLKNAIDGYYRSLCNITDSGYSLFKVKPVVSVATINEEKEEKDNCRLM